MRIIVVWITAVTMIFVLGLSWWITIPAIIGVSHSLNSTYAGNPYAVSISRGVEYLVYAWGPVLVIFILVWAVFSSQRRDVESTMWS